MPQLDTATYRGQVTWLVIVFGVLYRVTRGDRLPKFNTIVKLRNKKRERTRGDVNQYDGERNKVENGVSGRLGNAAGSSHHLLQETMFAQNQWRETTMRERTQVERMKKANERYRSHRMNSNRRNEYMEESQGKAKN